MMKSTRPETSAHHVHATLGSPIGQLTVIASDRGVSAILWDREQPDDRGIVSSLDDGSNLVLRQTLTQLGEYFAGQRRTFDVPLDFQGTSFQREVWEALLTIPFGVTRTYGDIAARIGRPRASRAVGAANGQNPIPIIAPCHRVIGASGALTGFGGGLDVKVRLLALEGVTSERWANATATTPRRRLC